MKINCAVSELPNFECFPTQNGKPGPQHYGTIHFENKMEELEVSAREAWMGMPASRPIVEMTIPSSLDNTLAPPGKHVVQLFVQFAPYHIDPKIGSWADPGFKGVFAVLPVFLELLKKLLREGFSELSMNSPQTFRLLSSAPTYSRL